MEAGRARWLLGMELARARARAAEGRDERLRALSRAGDAYERARAPRAAGEEAAPPGAGEAFWRALGRLLAWLLGWRPELRRALEERLLSAGPPS